MMLYVKNRSVKHVHCLSVTFPVPGIQRRQENILIVSYDVYRLLLNVLFSEGHMVEWLSCLMYRPLEI